MKNQFKFSLSLIALASLAACGGGGGSDSNPSTSATAAVSCSVNADFAEYGAAAKSVETVDCATATARVDAALKDIPAKRAELIAQRDAAVAAGGAKGEADAAVANAKLQILDGQEAGLLALKDQIAVSGKVDTALQARLDAAKAAIAQGNTNLQAALAQQTIAYTPVPVVTDPIVTPPVVVDPGTTPPVVTDPNPPVVTDPNPPVVVNPPPVVTDPTPTPVVKFHGIWAAENGVVISETDGTTWFLDTTAAGPDAVRGKVKMDASTENTINIPSQSLSYTHANVAVTGSYVKGTSANLALAYPANPDLNAPARTSNLLLTYDIAYDTNLVMPAGALTGSDFYTGSEKVGFTISADGKTFTGNEDTCTFTGAFASTGMGYNKVTITWGDNCAVPKDTVGSGVVAKYGDVFVLMTNQAGLWDDNAFVTFLTPTKAVVTAPTTTLPTTVAAKKYMVR